MSRARHKAAGGRLDPDDASTGEKPKVTYAGKGSNVEKEADDDKEGGERKHGGKVMKRKHGGKVMHKMEHHKMEGEAAKERLDRPKRKSGGRCGGSDMSPLSSASQYD